MDVDEGYVLGVEFLSLEEFAEFVARLGGYLEHILERSRARMEIVREKVE